MDARTATALLSAARVAVGVALLAAPERTAAGWLGRRVVSASGGRIAVQAIGIRDVVAGGGALAVLAAGGDDRELARWVAASMVADSVDVASTLASGRRGTGKQASTGLALGAAAAGAACLAALSRSRR